MKVELTIAEAVKLADTFKVLYHYSAPSRELDKRVRSEYLNLIRKIEEAETAMIIEREKRSQEILNSHEERNIDNVTSY